MNLKNLYGHEQNEKLLAKVINSANISSSWLFHGRHGVGKRTFAYRFIAYILAWQCSSDNLLTSEQVQETLKAMLGGVHPDFLLLDCRSSDVSIENYRNTANKLYKKPAVSDSKAMLILGAEMLSLNVYNALLKLSEEPPQNTYIIITTSNILRLPLTLRSRCAKLLFNKLSYDNIHNIADEIGVAVTEESILLADGSINDAITFSDASVYDEYLNIFSVCTNITESIDSITQKYNVNENWVILKRCIIRSIQAFTNIALGIDCNLLPTEKAIMRNVNVQRLQNASREVIDLLSLAETMKLDKASTVRQAIYLITQRIINN